MLSTYSKLVNSDAMILKFVGEAEEDGRRFSGFSVEMGQRTRIRLRCAATTTVLVSASRYFLQIDRVSIVNVLGKVKMRAKDEAGSSEVAEEA